MRKNQHEFPVYVRMGWVDYSPALREHAPRRVRARLAEFDSRIRWASIRFSPDETQATARRRCDLEVMVAHVGPIFGSAVGTDLFTLVDRATDAVAERLRQRANAEREAELRQLIA